MRGKGLEIIARIGGGTGPHTARESARRHTSVSWPNVVLNVFEESKKGPARPAERGPTTLMGPEEPESRVRPAEPAGLARQEKPIEPPDKACLSPRSGQVGVQLELFPEGSWDVES